MASRSELATAVHQKLGEQLHPTKMNAVVLIHENLNQLREKLNERLKSGSIDQQEYLKRYQVAQTHAHNDLALILGHDDMHLIFGESDPLGVADKESLTRK